MERLCKNCKYAEALEVEAPCVFCVNADYSNEKSFWEPKEGNKIEESRCNNMYVNPFIAGVVLGILIETVLLLIVAYYVGRKK